MAILLGAWFGRTIGRRVSAIDRGLATFADGHLEERVDETGTEEMRRIAHSANTMAKRIQEDRDKERELVAGLAHDLAHPLTALRNSLEAARDGLTAGVEPDAADRLLRSVENVEATLSDLRDVAAFDAGLIRLEWTVTSLSDTVTQAVEQYRYVASRRGVTLEALAEDSIFVRTDRRRLSRIVANLIVNALAATLPDGYVRVCARHEGDHAILSVDDSAGAQASERLRAALRDGVHAGLGLRVVRALAAAVGVPVDVHASADGSSVRIRLSQETVPREPIPETVGSRD